MPPLKTALFIIIVCCLSACSHTPERRSKSICPECEGELLNQQKEYPLHAYSKNFSGVKKTVLHVYIEGDGLTWSPKGYPNKNPNSHKLTALKLMTLDTSPSIYINRPCYGFKKMPKNCNYKLWTSDRYSELVIDSINQSLNSLQQQNYFKKIILIGHSGGGTIAMLLANRRQDVLGVITLSANLDHQRWTDYFGTPPLTGSLNPADQPLLKGETFRWHFAGNKDKMVPSELIKEFAAKDPNAKFILKNGYDHTCCWEQDWETTLSMINKNQRK